MGFLVEFLGAVRANAGAGGSYAIDVSKPKAVAKLIEQAAHGEK